MLVKEMLFACYVHTQRKSLAIALLTIILSPILLSSDLASFSEGKYLKFISSSGLETILLPADPSVVLMLPSGQ
jgi:hypothetical protein